jgi:hypothetical protein
VVAVPSLLQGPGTIRIAPLGSTVPSNTVSGSVFTDAWDVAWVQPGATEDGTSFQYQLNTQPVEVAEFFDPIQYATVSRSGTLAFNLASFTLSNYQRALNKGVTALTPTSGTGATALYNVKPPVPGAELRCMIGWESTDLTVRAVFYQCIQGGTIQTDFKKNPSIATIPCTFNLEVPSSGNPFDIWSAGTSHG